MPSVIVGIDDSPAAPAVARAGAQLAGWLGLRLVLAHAVDTPRVLPYGDVTKTEFERRRAIREARPMLERIDPVPGGADSYRVAFGAPADALSQVAYEESGALLVVGSRGRGTLRSAATGSVSRALAHEGLLPVVVVPPTAAVDGGEVEDDVRVVVCGVDDSPSARAAADVAARIAEAAGLRLVPVHVEADADGSPAEELDRIAQEEDAALIVVGSRGRGVISEMLSRSTAGDLAAGAARPVLVVPQGAGVDPALALQA